MEINMKYKDVLESILLSENALTEFYNNYKDEFKDWLDKLLPEIDKCIKQKQINHST